MAIVTGGSGGIGRAAAERLGADGIHVVVHYAGNAGRAQETAAQITAAGGTATALKGDVADEAGMAALFDAAEELYGGIDVVVHTAGIMPLSPLADLDLGEFDGKDQTTIDHLASAPAMQRLGQPGDIASVVAFLAGPGRWVNGQVIAADQPMVARPG